MGRTAWVVACTPRMAGPEGRRLHVPAADSAAGPFQVTKTAETGMLADGGGPRQVTCGPGAGRYSCSGWCAPSPATARWPAARPTTCGAPGAARSRARSKVRPCGFRRSRSSHASTVRRPRASGAPAAEGTARSASERGLPMTRSCAVGTGGSAGTAGEPRPLWRP